MKFQMNISVAAPPIHVIDLKYKGFKTMRCDLKVKHQIKRF